MNMKTIFSLIIFSSLVGCTTDESKNESYLKIEEDIAVKIEKNTYTCNDDEFFFIEKPVGARIINFIYGSYSSPLSKKPSKTEFYSDGVYNVSFFNNEAIVKLRNDIVLHDCKKIK